MDKIYFNVPARYVCSGLRPAVPQKIKSYIQHKEKHQELTTQSFHVTVCKYTSSDNGEILHILHYMLVFTIVMDIGRKNVKLPLYNKT